MLCSGKGGLVLQGGGGVKGEDISHLPRRGGQGGPRRAVEPHPGVAGRGWGVWAVFGVGFGVCGSLRSFLELPGVLGSLGSPTGPSAEQGRGSQGSPGLRAELGGSP